MKYSYLITLCLVIQKTSAVFRTVCDTFAFANMDPIVSPGARSGHQHTIAGSLGFSDRIVESWMRGNDSTCDIVGDLSDYWAPTMILLSGSTRVPLTPIIQSYYEVRSKDVDDAHASALTSPIAMLVGDSSGKSALDTEHVKFICTIRDGNGLRRSRSPVPGFHEDATCDEYRIDYSFPSCWNGQPYSPTQSHVAYPNNKGACPPTHPSRFPALRIEHRHILPERMSWSNGNAPFTLSSGDANTAHADAVLLWDPSVLGYLIQNCAGPSDDCVYRGIVRLTKTQRAANAKRYVVPAEYAMSTMDMASPVVTEPVPTEPAPVLSEPTPEPTVP